MKTFKVLFTGYFNGRFSQAYIVAKAESAGAAIKAAKETCNTKNRASDFHAEEI